MTRGEQRIDEDCGGPNKNFPFIVKLEGKRYFTVEKFSMCTMRITMLILTGRANLNLFDEDVNAPDPDRSSGVCEELDCGFITADKLPTGGSVVSDQPICLNCIC